MIACVQAWPVDTLLSGPVVEHLLATVREALTNVGKHAQAARASVRLSVDPTRCRLVIADDGLGLPEATHGSGGLGLPNLRHRAEKCKGTLSIEEAPEGGTVLTWSVPLDA